MTGGALGIKIAFHALPGGAIGFAVLAVAVFFVCVHGFTLHAFAALALPIAGSAIPIFPLVKPDDNRAGVCPPGGGRAGKAFETAAAAAFGSGVRTAILSSAFCSLGKGSQGISAGGVFRTAFGLLAYVSLQITLRDFTPAPEQASCAARFEKSALRSGGGNFSATLDSGAVGTAVGIISDAGAIPHKESAVTGKSDTLLIRRSAVGAIAFAVLIPVDAKINAAVAIVITAIIAVFQAADFRRAAA